MAPTPTDISAPQRAGRLATTGRQRATSTRSPAPPAHVSAHQACTLHADQAASAAVACTGHQLLGDEEEAKRYDIRMEGTQEPIDLDLMVAMAGFVALDDGIERNTLLLELRRDGHELAIVNERNEDLFGITGIVDELFLPGGCVAIHGQNALMRYVGAAIAGQDAQPLKQGILTL